MSAGRNDRLLPLSGNDHKAAVGLYQAERSVFIVLVAGVVMIYNTFNISVMDRMRSPPSRCHVESADQEAGEKKVLLLRWRFRAALWDCRRSLLCAP